jgi:hypothetical protein
MNRVVPPLVFVICASSVIDVATDTPSVEGHWLGPFFQLTPATQATSACCAGVLIVLAAWMLFGRTGDSSVSQSSHDVWTRVLRLLPMTSMLFAFFWTRPHVYPALVIPWSALVVGAPLFLCVATLKRWPPFYIATAAAIAGVAVRMVHFARFSMDEGADMLPLTRSALARFVAGTAPYTHYDLPNPVPLTYYPLTWLAFLPAYLAHVDLRWTNIAAEMAILAAIVRAGKARENAPEQDGNIGTAFMNPADVALLAWSFYFLLPSSVYFDRITTAPVAWALLAWCVALSARESKYASVVLGLTAAATPLAAIVGPFVFVMWWRRLSLRGAVSRTGKAALVATLILAPFVVWSPRGFLEGAVLWFNDLSRYPGTTWRAYRPWQRYIGFGGLFWRAGLERALAPVQWSLVGGLTALFARKRARAGLLPSYVAAAFVAFMAFNSVHWPYFYQPALFGALVAIAVASPELTPRDLAP